MVKNIDYFNFFMILVGGLTRLTDSGLSITEWNYSVEFYLPQ